MFGGVEHDGGSLKKILWSSLTYIVQINLCYENIILRKCIKQDGKLKNHVSCCAGDKWK